MTLPVNSVCFASLCARACADDIVYVVTNTLPARVFS